MKKFKNHSGGQGIPGWDAVCDKITVLAMCETTSLKGVGEGAH